MLLQSKFYVLKNVGALFNQFVSEAQKIMLMNKYSSC
jgi:hypothetical protein